MTPVSLIDRLSRVWLVLAGFYVLAWVAVTVYLLNETGADTREIDLAAFWAEARMALDGQAVAAFDRSELSPYMGQILDFGGGYLSWRYPAPLHLILAPIGVLPFTAAYVFVVAVSWVAIAMVLSKDADALPGGLNLVLGAPVVLFTLTTGQISVLLAAILAAGLNSLARGRHVQAGLWLGIISLKPSLLPIVIVAVLFSREWIVLIWAGLCSVALAVAGTLVFGLEHWQAFFASLPELRQELSSGSMPVDRMVSPFAFFRTVGLSQYAAEALHLTFALGLAGGTALVWARQSDFRVKFAVLCLAIPMATPYAHYYEMVFALLAIVFLAQIWTPLNWRCGLLLAALWIGPLPGLMFWKDIPLAFYAPPFMIVAFAVSVVEALRGTHQIRGSNEST